MLKLGCSLILGISMLVSQFLLVAPLVQAEDSSDDDFLPPPLQEVVSVKAYAQAPLEGVRSMSASPSTPGHFLYGGLEEKVTAPLPASIDTTRLLKESPKMAASENQVHKLAAQQDALVNGDKQVWFRIPPWLAGKWKTQDRQLIGEINYRNGKQTPPRSLSFGYCGELYGLQQDKNGTYWQFEKVASQPTNYKVDKNGLAHFNVVESNHSLSSSDIKLVLKKIWRGVTMNPETQEIVNERRFESVLTFKRLDDQSMSVNEAIETFDVQGAPISMKLIQTVRVKVAPFQPVDNLHGDDTRSLFSRYMNPHGMGNLVAKND
jgi:hypothetical protein